MKNVAVFLIVCGLIGIGLGELSWKFISSAHAADAREPVRATGRARLYIDPDTGCHYLLNRDGGITPRLSGDGRQLCIL